MDVIREIKRVESNPLIINVPDEYLNKQVEITILPLTEKKKKEDKISEFLKFIEENQFKLPEDYKFVREELYDR